jgi:hypothetical protein
MLALGVNLHRALLALFLEQQAAPDNLSISRRCMHDVSQLPLILSDSDVESVDHRSDTGSAEPICIDTTIAVLGQWYSSRSIQGPSNDPEGAQVVDAELEEIQHILVSSMYSL